MRSFPITVLTMMLSSAALAQTMATPAAPPATTSAPAPQGVSRDDYIAKFRDAAEKRAATRFDAMDANHDGVLTKEEVAAYRAAHARNKPAEPQ